MVTGRPARAAVSVINAFLHFAFLHFLASQYTGALMASRKRKKAKASASADGPNDALRYLERLGQTCPSSPTDPRPMNARNLKTRPTPSSATDGGGLGPNGGKSGYSAPANSFHLPPHNVARPVPPSLRTEATHPPRVSRTRPSTSTHFNGKGRSKKRALSPESDDDDWPVEHPSPPAKQATTGPRISLDATHCPADQDAPTSRMGASVQRPDASQPTEANADDHVGTKQKKKRRKRVRIYFFSCLVGVPDLEPYSVKPLQTGFSIETPTWTNLYATMGCCTLPVSSVKQMGSCTGAATVYRTESGVGTASSPIIKLRQSIASRYVQISIASETGHSSPNLSCQVWTGNFWDRTTLIHLGLVYQFGHFGGTCPKPMPQNAPLTVLSMTGQHRVKVAYCGCSSATVPVTPEREQCLRARWFPASVISIRTVVALDCLEVFHHLNLEGKLAAYEFYNMLSHRTDNTEVNPPKVFHLPYFSRVSC